MAAALTLSFIQQHHLDIRLPGLCTHVVVTHHAVEVVG